MRSIYYMVRLFHWIRNKFGFNTAQNDYYEPLVIDTPNKIEIKVVERPKQNKIKIKRKKHE